MFEPVSTTMRKLTVDSEPMAQRQRVGFQTRRLGVRIPLASLLPIVRIGLQMPPSSSNQCAFLAQMVERWPFKPMVVGSIPTEGVAFL